MDTYYDINKRFMAKPHAAFPFNFAFTTKLNLLTLCCFLSQIYFLQPCSTKQTTYIDIPQKKLIGYHYYPFYYYHYCYYNDDNCTCSLSLCPRETDYWIPTPLKYIGAGHQCPYYWNKRIFTAFSFPISFIYTPKAKKSIQRQLLDEAKPSHNGIPFFATNCHPKMYFLRVVWSAVTAILVSVKWSFLVCLHTRLLK